VNLQKARKLENLKSSSMVQGKLEITRLPQISRSYKNITWWVWKIQNYRKGPTSPGMLEKLPSGSKITKKLLNESSNPKLQEIPRMFGKPLKRVFHRDHENTTITIRKHHKKASNFLYISFGN